MPFANGDFAAQGIEWIGENINDGTMNGVDIKRSLVDLVMVLENQRHDEATLHTTLACLKRLADAYVIQLK